jgi:hypothetical protein
LRFRLFQEWGAEVLHDEGTVLGVRDAGFSEDHELGADEALKEIDGALDQVYRRLGVLMAEGARPTNGETLHNTTIKVFISHSSADIEIATALIELLRDAMPDLHPPTIRCTSVPGYKLFGGADTDNQLRQEMREALVFVGFSCTSPSKMPLYYGATGT